MSFDFDAVDWLVHSGSESLTAHTDPRAVVKSTLHRLDDIKLNSLLVSLNLKN